ncbi:MAG: hypothetical protein ABF289_06080 [Clostridiales bacterium]
MDRIILTDIEINYLGYLNKKDSLYGIETNLEKLTHSEVTKKFENAKRSLIEKKYIKLSKNNEIIISRIIYFITIVCFEAEKFIRIDIKKDKKSAFLINYYIYREGIIFVEKSRIKSNEFIFNIVKDFEDLKDDFLDILTLLSDVENKEFSKNININKEDFLELINGKKIKKNVNPFDDNISYNIPEDVEKIFSKGILSVFIDFIDFTKNSEYKTVLIHNKNILGKCDIKNDEVEIKKLKLADVYSDIDEFCSLII